MEAKYDSYSIKKLVGDLAAKFAGITEVHIFGSRRHRTMSTRSDLDLLVKADQSVRPDDVRDFALQECPVLDVFFMDRGIAVSCANGSKVKGKNDKDLVYQLHAVKIWGKKSGFTDADIDWDFQVIKGHNPPMTTLISTCPLPSKYIPAATDTPITTDAKGRSRWRELENHPLKIIVCVIIATVVVTYAVINQWRIIPLRDRIAWLDKGGQSIAHGNNMAQPVDSAAQFHDFGIFVGVFEIPIGEVVTISVPDLKIKFHHSTYRIIPANNDTTFYYPEFHVSRDDGKSPTKHERFEVGRRLGVTTTNYHYTIELLRLVESTSDTVASFSVYRKENPGARPDGN